MQIMDCTLRDGSNVVGQGFSAELTTMMLSGLVRSGVKIIEMGNCSGLGAYDLKGSTKALTDAEYLDLAAPYCSKAQVGMFMGAGNARDEYIKRAADKGLSFLRVGNNAGDGAKSLKAVKMVKNAGMKAFYALMKAYVLSPAELAAEASMLADNGVDTIIIMDSAGTMVPEQAAEYTSALVKAVKIPVGFHGHSNLGLAIGNALAAARSGASIIDCGLMGMARSAGNISTEAVIAALMHVGIDVGSADLWTMLKFIDDELAPAMLKYDYHSPICPLDIVLGYSGCHSHFVPLFEEVARAKGVDLYQLIVKASLQDRKAPSRALIESVATSL